MVTDNLTLDPRRVVVGLSGGVDSAVAAALLGEQGYDVVGAVLQTWRAAETGAAGDAAGAVASALGVPLHILDVRQRFYDTVVAPFAVAYAQGRTPNPCVICNPTLKFAALLELADRVGAHWIATGHYARVTRDAAGVAHLLRARHRKDQAYMLYRLWQHQLRRLLLPLGDVADKAEVRARAQNLELPSAKQADSQDLCFMPSGDYRALLRELRPEAARPGPIYDEAGRELGEHTGLPHYTVGQRGGLGITAPERLYVLRLDAQRNALVVGPRASLRCDACQIESVTWIAGAPPATDFAAEGAIRYRARPVPAQVHVAPEHRAEVRFAQPQESIAPGQSLVLYRGDEVLGGGIIDVSPA